MASRSGIHTATHLIDYVAVLGIEPEAIIFPRKSATTSALPNRRSALLKIDGPIEDYDLGYDDEYDNDENDYAKVNIKSSNSNADTSTSSSPTASTSSSNNNNTGNNTGGSFKVSIRGKSEWEGELLVRYPLEDNPKFKLPVLLPLFSFPLNVRLSKTRRAPTFHSFVMTENDGHKFYGFCFTKWTKVSTKRLKIINRMQRQSRLETFSTLFIPVCLCIVSHWPYHVAFHRFFSGLCATISFKTKFGPRLLKQIYTMLHVPFPVPGGTIVRFNQHQQHLQELTASGTNEKTASAIRFYYPENEKTLLPPADVDFSLLVNHLSNRSIMTIFNLILMEKQIMFVSRSHALLTHIIEAFTLLLYPFQWPHVYIPILHKSLYDFLEAPLPYLIGMHTSLLDVIDAPPQTVVIDLDYERIMNPQAFVPFSAPDAALQASGTDQRASAEHGRVRKASRVDPKHHHYHVLNSDDSIGHLSEGIVQRAFRKINKFRNKVAQARIQEQLQHSLQQTLYTTLTTGITFRFRDHDELLRKLSARTLKLFESTIEDLNHEKKSLLSAMVAGTSPAASTPATSVGSSLHSESNRHHNNRAVAASQSSTSSMSNHSSVAGSMLSSVASFNSVPSAAASPSPSAAIADKKEADKPQSNDNKRTGELHAQLTQSQPLQPQTPQPQPQPQQVVHQPQLQPIPQSPQPSPMRRSVRTPSKRGNYNRGDVHSSSSSSGEEFEMEDDSGPYSRHRDIDDSDYDSEEHNAHSATQSQPIATQNNVNNNYNHSTSSGGSATASIPVPVPTHSNTTTNNPVAMPPTTGAAATATAEHKADQPDLTSATVDESSSDDGADDEADNDRIAAPFDAPFSPPSTSVSMSNKTRRRGTLIETRKEPEMPSRSVSISRFFAPKTPSTTKPKESTTKKKSTTATTTIAAGSMSSSSSSSSAASSLSTVASSSSVDARISGGSAHTSPWMLSPVTSPPETPVSSVDSNMTSKPVGITTEPASSSTFSMDTYSSSMRQGEHNPSALLSSSYLGSSLISPVLMNELSSSDNTAFTSTVSSTQQRSSFRRRMVDNSSDVGFKPNTSAAVSDPSFVMRKSFLSLFVRLFKSYQQYLVFPTERDPNPVSFFESERFIADQKDGLKSFFSSFVTTQLFQFFIQDRMDPSHDPNSPATNDVFDHRVKGKMQRLALNLSILASTTKEGMIWKKGQMRKSWKYRYFQLKGNELVYFVNQTMTTAKGKLTLTPGETKFIIPQMEKDQPAQYPFLIVTPERTLHCCTNDKQARKDWWRVIAARSMDAQLREGLVRRYQQRIGPAQGASVNKGSQLMMREEPFLTFLNRLTAPIVNQMSNRASARYSVTMMSFDPSLLSIEDGEITATERSLREFSDAEEESSEDESTSSSSSNATSTTSASTSATTPAIAISSPAGSRSTRSNSVIRSPAPTSITATAATTLTSPDLTEQPPATDTTTGVATEAEVASTIATVTEQNTALDALTAEASDAEHETNATDNNGDDDDDDEAVVADDESHDSDSHYTTSTSASEVEIDSGIDVVSTSTTTSTTVDVTDTDTHTSHTVNDAGDESEAIAAVLVADDSCESITSSFEKVDLTDFEIAELQQQQQQQQPLL